MKEWMIVVVAMLVMAGCSSSAEGTEPVATADAADSAPETPPPDAPPECEVRDTGRIVLDNGGNAALTATVNGIDRGRIETGGALTLDLPPGAYQVDYLHLDGSVACNRIVINVGKCTRQEVKCAH